MYTTTISNWLFMFKTPKQLFVLIHVTTTFVLLIFVVVGIGNFQFTIYISN